MADEKVLSPHSSSDGVIGIFRWHNPSGRTMALGSTQPLTEMSTGNISWGVKAAGAYGWQPCHLHVPTVLKSGSLDLLEPSGPVQACNGTALPLPHSSYDLCQLCIGPKTRYLMLLSMLTVHTCLPSNNKEKIRFLVFSSWLLCSMRIATLHCQAMYNYTSS